MMSKNDKKENIFNLDGHTYRYFLIILLLSLFCFFVIGPVLSLLLQTTNSSLNYILIYSPFLLFLLIFTVLWCKVLKQPLGLLFSPFYSWRKALFIMVAISYLVLLFINDFIFDKAYTANGFNPLMLLSLLLIPFQTLAEEVIFRVSPLIIASRFDLNKKSVKTILILLSGVLFALMHSSNPEIAHPLIILYYLFWGLFTMAITLYTKGIEVTYALHLVNNLFITIVMNYPSSALPQTAFFTKISFPNTYNLLIFEVISFLLITIESKGFINGQKENH